MLCSSCSQEVKPVVAIDVDGVLGDYHGHFLRFACAYLGKDIEKLLKLSIDMFDGSEPFREYCAREFNITVGEYREIKLAYRQGAMKRSMPVEAGAVALCSSLKVHGAELWITTTRPYLSLDGVIKDTVFWLELHDIVYDGLLFDDDKYTVLAERIDPERVVAVLDDVDEMYDAAALLFGADVPILYQNKYNAAMVPGRDYVDSLGTASFKIWDQLADWRELHD